MSFSFEKFWVFSAPEIFSIWPDLFSGERDIDKTFDS